MSATSRHCLEFRVAYSCVPLIRIFKWQSKMYIFLSISGRSFSNFEEHVLIITTHTWVGIRCCSIIKMIVLAFCFVFVFCLFVGWLIGWLADWLVGWFCVVLFCFVLETRWILSTWSFIFRSNTLTLISTRLVHIGYQMAIQICTYEAWCVWDLFIE